MKLLLAASLFVSTIVPQPLPAAEGDAFWWDGFGLPDVDGWVNCAVEHQGSIVIGGRFSRVGGIDAQNIARWDGQQWSAFGPGFDRDVQSLVVHQGQLVAGGSFVTSGARMLNGIGRWNGQEWTELGSGMSGGPWGVQALASNGSVLYAGGAFLQAGGVEVNGVARWNGIEWSALGSGLQGGDQDYFGIGRALYATGDSLFVGGRFDSAGGVPASRIALWDGDSWVSLGSGVEIPSLYGQPEVTSLLRHEDRLYVGGSFQFAGGVRTNNVAAWDGQSWQAVGDTALNGIPPLVNALAWVGSDLLVASYYLHAWNGNDWILRPPFHTGAIYCLVPTSRGVLVGGRFLGYGEGGGIGAVSVGFLHDQGWLDPIPWNDRTRGLGGYGFAEVRALASYAGGVVASGSFTYAGSPTGRTGLGAVARWNGESWSTLGSAPYGNTLALLPVGSKLYAGGFFSWSWPNITPVMVYEGGVWTPLDTLSVEASSLAFHAGSLYLAGRRTYYQGPRTEGIHRWDGSRWEHIGVPNEVYSAIRLKSFGGRLIAAGYFDSLAGVPVHGVASWDGATWSPMDGILRAQVDALAECGGSLYAAGRFLGDGPGAYAELARWDGVRWTLLPLAADPLHRARILSLACAEGQLFGGGYVLAEDNTERGVARWDGAKWAPLGSGVNGGVFAMTELDGSLFVGGRFSMAGGKSSSAIARWDLREELHQATLVSARSGVPNPFQTSTSFAYRLTAPGRVRVTVHDLRGCRVAVLEEGDRPSGTGLVIWNGVADDGRAAPAGVYFVRIELPGRTETRRVVRLK